MSHPELHQPPSAHVDPSFRGRVVEVDVRDDLRNGREPFSRIMAARQALADGEVLRLRATFEPVPLFRVMERQGFEHLARHHGPEDWSVWFFRPEDAPVDGARDDGDTIGTIAPPAASNDRADAASADAAEVVLDVRGLEPPQPMVRTLEALETLPAGAALVQLNARVPQFLLPILSERGFVYEVDESSSDAVIVRIRRAD
ncbi:MAG TPA: DUF2249 domain-containing protein [Gemmatimonadales bacterium]